MGALMEVAKSQLDKPDTVLNNEVNLKGFAKAIKSGKITLAGAGISTSCGIPDFRSPKTGLYANLQKYNLQNAEDIFTLSYFMKNPEPFFDLSRELMPNDEFKPSITHYFIKLLNDKGILRRHYTQNIDGLEVASGLNEEKCIEAHGHYRTGRCQKCRELFEQSYFRPKIMKKQIPRCDVIGCGGVVKPDVVFFGEGLPDKFFDYQKEDFDNADLLIIMGSSLKVHPFAGLIEKVASNCPRLLINMTHSASYILNDEHRDYFLQGTCDDGIEKLAKEIGWWTELKEMRDAAVKEQKSHL